MHGISIATIESPPPPPAPHTWHRLLWTMLELLQVVEFDAESGAMALDRRNLFRCGVFRYSCALENVSKLEITEVGRPDFAAECFAATADCGVVIPKAVRCCALGVPRCGRRCTRVL